MAAEKMWTEVQLFCFEKIRSQIEMQQTLLPGQMSVIQQIKVIPDHFFKRSWTACKWKCFSGKGNVLKDITYYCPCL